MAWALGAFAVVLIFLLSRKAGVAAIIFLSLVYLSLWLFYDNQSAGIPSNRSIAITAGSDTRLCPTPGKPISVVFKNASDKSLENAAFSLIARESGHSSVIYRALLRSDKIIAPGDSYSTCYSLNPRSFVNSTQVFDPRELDWSAEISLAEFSTK